MTHTQWVNVAYLSFTLNSCKEIASDARKLLWANVTEMTFEERLHNTP